MTNCSNTNIPIQIILNAWEIEWHTGISQGILSLTLVYVPKVS